MPLVVVVALAEAVVRVQEANAASRRTAFARMAGRRLQGSE
jgi:hypothetical protein